MTQKSGIACTKQGYLKLSCNIILLGKSYGDHWDSMGDKVESNRDFQNERDRKH